MRKAGLIILGLIVLLALGGGAAAVYMLFLAPKNSQDATIDPNDLPPPVPVKRPAFIPLEPFSVYVRPEGQPPREVIVILHLEVPTDNVSIVNDRMHILRDRFVREMLKGDPIPVPDRFTARDLYLLRDELKGPTEEIMGKGVVTQVLLLNIIGQLK